MLLHVLTHMFISLWGPSECQCHQEPSVQCLMQLIAYMREHICAGEEDQGG